MYEQHNLPKKQRPWVSVLIVLGILLGIYLLSSVVFLLQQSYNGDLISFLILAALLIGGYLFLSHRDASYAYRLADEKLTLERILLNRVTVKVEIPLKNILSVALCQKGEKGLRMLGRGYEGYCCVYTEQGQEKRILFAPDHKMLALLEGRNNIDAYIERTAPSVFEKLSQLLQIPSVKAAPAPGAPFGEPAAKALETVLAFCASLGMRTKNLNGYCGYAELGEGEAELGILTHLDVVPAGEGWVHPPFGGVIENDVLYGRGALDNKGPAMASVLALHAASQSGFSFDRRVRLIFGCDEESGWECMKHYAENEKLPDMAFTPDAEYPVIITEKGICHLHLSAVLQEGDYSLQIGGGERPNVVPGVARATVRGNMDRLFPTLMDFDAHSNGLQFAVEGDTLTVTSYGSAAHASTPEKGTNAFFKLFEFLNALSLGGDQGKFIRTVTLLFANQYYGQGVKGLQLSDEQSGPLTLNLGLCYCGANDIYPAMRPQDAALDLDIRYPVTARLEGIIQSLQNALPPDWDISVTYHQLPHSVDKDHILVRSLLKVYKRYTGLDSPPIAIGGGTYARTIPSAVAFGPIFEGQISSVHDKEEHIALDDFILNAQIFAAAIRELAGKHDPEQK